MIEPLNIALLGCGTVGGGVAKMLLEQGERLAARAGRPLRLRRVVVREPEKARTVMLPPEIVSADFRAAINSDPEVRAVLSAEKIAASFSLDRQLRNVDRIFDRVFSVRE